VDSDHRRRGHARAALRILLDIAGAEPGVHTVRASVRPDNLPSRRLVDAFGFRAVGRQWDEDDGWETVLQLGLA
jgi:RimJ/RimL family protein N-acetyltransferase